MVKEGVDKLSVRCNSFLGVAAKQNGEVGVLKFDVCHSLHHLAFFMDVFKLTLNPDS